jgi:hypothetical protein
MIQDPKLPFASNSVPSQWAHCGLLLPSHGACSLLYRIVPLLCQKNASNKIAYLFAFPLFCRLIVANKKGQLQDTITLSFAMETGIAKASRKGREKSHEYE